MATERKPLLSVLLFSLFIGAAAPDPIVSVTGKFARTKIPTEFKSFAAIGDSYAAGVGAGRQLDTDCWRYSSGYPAQLLNSDLLGGNNYTLQLLACSGSVMTKEWSVAGGRLDRKREIWTQIEAIKDAAFVTLSIGGNDVGFGNVLNACLYRFFGPVTPNCEATRKTARARIQSKEFNQTYNKVLDAVLKKASGDSFRVFVTGYGKFFEEDLSDGCNNKSLGYWRGYQPKLTVKLRKDINEICDLFNKKIGQIIKEKGDGRVILVDWDQKFESHRFCPSNKELKHEETWFYDASFRMAHINPFDGTSCQSDLMEFGGDWRAQALCEVAVTGTRYPDLLASGNWRPPGGRDLLGPHDAKLFHPTSEGHKAIAERIQEVWPYGGPVEEIKKHGGI